MSRIRLFIALVVALTAGCATDIPVPSGHSPSEQAKLRATHHWDIVAADIAMQMSEQLATLGAGPAVYVQPALNQSPFEVAMHEFVITHLVDNGVPVELDEAGARQVTLATQLITNVSERDISAGGPLTAIATGITVDYNVARHRKPQLSIGVSASSAAAYDVGTDRLPRSGAPSKTELIVTCSIVENGRFLMRRTDVYYIDDADLSLFVEPKPAPLTPTREYPVKACRELMNCPGL
jgi:hypothetical protein